MVVLEAFALLVGDFFAIVGLETLAELFWSIAEKGG